MATAFRSLWCAMLLFGWACLAGPIWASEIGVLRAIENEIAGILESNRDGVVRIHALYPRSREGSGPFGSVFTHGTGFVFDPDGYILTIDAAVQDAEEIRVTLASDVQVRAQLVGFDPVSGLAVIRADASGLSVLPLGNSDEIRVGHYAFILGNDFGNLAPAFGTVVDIFKDDDLIHVSARMQSSYGGAPVFCSDGKVGGVVWRYQTPVADASLRPLTGWNGMPSSVFVIPIKRAMRIAQALKVHGEMVYGWLGVEVERRGKDVVVLNVAPNSPALASGLRPGDVVVSYGNRRVAGPHHLRRMVMETAPGTSLMLDVRRGATEESREVVMGKMLQAPQTTARLSSTDMPIGDRELFQKINHLQQEVGRLMQLLDQK